MSSDISVPRARRATENRNPDQLQQAKRPDAPNPAPAAPAPGDHRPPDQGILGQLRTERAHD